MASEQTPQNVSSIASEQAPGRRKLNLKPRDPEAAAKLEAERQKHLSSKNPFGAAKPREAVIAEKLGKTEEEVLKEEVSKEKLHLRLSGSQLEEKREAEGAVKDVEEQLELESDEGKRTELTTELAMRQSKLDELMDKFAKATLETALSGGAPRVSQIRQQQQLQQETAGIIGGAPAARFPPGAPSSGGSFGGREFNDGGYGGGRGGAAPAGGRGGGRGFSSYQQRGGFADSYQQGTERQGSYGRRSGGGGSGGGGRLPEWALDDSSADAGFYDAPAATSAFIASGGYPSAAPPAGTASYGSGSFGSGGSGSGGNRGDGRGGGSGRGGGNRYDNGGYDAGGGGAGFAGRGLGGEFEYTEGDNRYGTGQDRF